MTAVPLPMTEKDRIVRFSSDYAISVEPGEVLVIHFPYSASNRGASFSHPNIARSRARVEEIKYGHRDWRKKTITTHVLVVRRDMIRLDKGDHETYPVIEVAGQRIKLSTSGGTCGQGWVDRLYTYCHTEYSAPLACLKAVAGVAVRGTDVEPYRFTDEIRDEFYAQHQNDWLSVSAFGSWHPTVPTGMVGVVATLGGANVLSDPRSRDRRHFLVPESEYRQRVPYLSFVIDPARHEVWSNPDR